MHTSKSHFIWSFGILLLTNCAQQSAGLEADLYECFDETRSCVSTDNAPGIPITLDLSGLVGDPTWKGTFTLELYGAKGWDDYHAGPPEPNKKAGYGGYAKVSFNGAYTDFDKLTIFTGRTPAGYYTSEATYAMIQSKNTLLAMAGGGGGAGFIGAGGCSDDRSPPHGGRAGGNGANGTYSAEDGKITSDENNNTSLTQHSMGKGGGSPAGAGGAAGVFSVGFARRLDGNPGQNYDLKTPFQPALGGSGGYGEHDYSGNEPGGDGGFGGQGYGGGGGGMGGLSSPAGCQTTGGAGGGGGGSYSASWRANAPSWIVKLPQQGVEESKLSRGHGSFVLTWSP